MYYKSAATFTKEELRKSDAPGDRTRSSTSRPCFHYSDQTLRYTKGVDGGQTDCFRKRKEGTKALFSSLLKQKAHMVKEPKVRCTGVRTALHVSLCLNEVSLPLPALLGWLRWPQPPAQGDRPQDKRTDTAASANRNRKELDRCS
jgi:hypothetical protein